MCITCYFDPDILMPGDPSASGIPHWLPTNNSLPLFSPMLRNLKALNISYDGDWHLLSSRVGSLMRRPSLVHVRVGDSIPSSIINSALGPNVKHLMLPCLETHDGTEDTRFLMECPNQPTPTEHLHSSLRFPLPTLAFRSPTYKTLLFTASPLKST